MGLYEDSGVDPHKKDVHQAAAGLPKGLYPGAFCKIFPDIAGFPDWVSSLHGDGVGTKIQVYYLMYKLGLVGPEIFRRAVWDAFAMNVDDLACVGAVGYPYALIDMVSRHKHRIPPEVLTEILAGFNEVCAWYNDYFKVPAQFQSGLWGGETADVNDLVSTLDVMCAVFVRWPQAKVIDTSRIRPGDFAVGFGSDGRAVYETAFNSGMMSNGLTLGRRQILSPVYNLPHYFPESVFRGDNNTLKPYVGKYLFSDPLEADPRFTAGSALASPTRCYAPLIAALIDAIPHGNLDGLTHCTGGGTTKSLGFGQAGDRGLIYRKSGYSHFLPGIFRELLKSGVPVRDLLQSFNCGIGLEAYVRTRHDVEQCFKVAESLGIEAHELGQVEERDKPGNEVVVDFEDQEYRYEQMAA